MTDHDVVIVGGGLAGTMAVLAAVRRGLDAVWIADEVGPDAQSARWHAHLHRGRLYDPGREARLIEELQLNSTFWWSDPVQRFHAPGMTVAIGPDRAWADEFRLVLGGVRGEEVSPPYLRADSVAIRTDEAILDGPRFLSTARSAAERGSTVVRGRCRRLRRDGSVWSARVHTSEGHREVRARAAIVATGVDATELLGDGVRLDHASDIRLGRMLVVRGVLPRAAAIVPSRASGGLFFASREVRDGSGERVWLISDGFNSNGRHSPGALTDAWWSCSVVERLYAIVRAGMLDTARAAGYLAPKSRLAASPTQVPARGIATDADARLVVLTPSKGSASPGAALDALDALHPDARPARSRLLDLADALADAPLPARTFREQWESLDPSVSLRELRIPGTAALRSAAELYRAPESRRVRADRTLVGARTA